jgi:hypothetical protein
MDEIENLEAQISYLQEDISLISANNDAVFIFVVFGIAPPCGVDCCLVSSSTIPSVLLCAV